MIDSEPIFSYDYSIKKPQAEDAAGLGINERGTWI